MKGYIEREAVLEAVNFYDEDKIRAIPAADVREVVRAKWNYDRNENCALCSKCNEEIYLGAYHQFSHNYCPNCGARMDGDGK